jgi:hypothetical protein
VLADALQPGTAGEQRSDLQNRVAEALGVDLNSATWSAADLASVVSNSLFSMRKSLEEVMLKVSSSSLLHALSLPFFHVCFALCAILVRAKMRLLFLAILSALPPVRFVGCFRQEDAIDLFNKEEDASV